jgi:hypothetical protein
LDRSASGRDQHGSAGNSGDARTPCNCTTHRSIDIEAISAEHVTAITRKAVQRAMDGDLAAMRLVLETVCGSPNEAAPGHPLGLNLPKLNTAEACSLALDRVAAALCAGTCGRDAAVVLVQAIQLQLQAIKVMDIQRRLAALEPSVPT